MNATRAWLCLLLTVFLTLPAEAGFWDIVRNVGRNIVPSIEREAVRPKLPPIKIGPLPGKARVGPAAAAAAASAATELASLRAELGKALSEDIQMWRQFPPTFTVAEFHDVVWEASHATGLNDSEIGWICRLEVQNWRMLSAVEEEEVLKVLAQRTTLRNEVLGERWIDPKVREIIRSRLAPILDKAGRNADHSITREPTPEE